MLVAFCTAWTPVSDSISTEHRYHTLHAAGAQRQKLHSLTQLLSANKCGANVFGDSVPQSIITGQGKKVWVSVDALISRSVTELSGFMHSAVIMSIRSKCQQGNGLPAPCFSSSAAELVTDCEVASTTSSRGSLSKKSKKNVRLFRKKSHSNYINK